MISLTDRKTPSVILIIIAICFGYLRHFLSEPSGLRRYGSIQGIQATGATATVFHYQLPNGSSFAVKTFLKRANGVSEDEYLASLRHEWNIASILSHPNVLPILDIFADNGCWHTAMPFIPITLFDRTLGNGAALTKSEGDCTFAQIVEGVAYMHQQGVAHLDLKPNNILLDGDLVKIIDFGHSQYFDKPQNATVEGRLGTPPNAPWEAYQRKHYDPFAADVWAVGMIYCQIVMPTVPWNLGFAADQFAIFDPSAVNGSLPRDEAHILSIVEMLGRNLPELSRPLILDMLESDPSQRVNMSEAKSTEWIQNLARSCNGIDRRVY
ncbi:map/microtubule affinity-regulating kinase [Penicillium lividum]|nr:map/microtubule affinity-regulating kinase [Penicillium lividum]